MKQLTELKDGQKVLIAFTVKKNLNVFNFQNELFDNNGHVILSLKNNLQKNQEIEEPQEIYDFNEVMNQKKSEPISKDKFFEKALDIVYLWSDDFNEGSDQRLIENFYNLLQSYYPIQEQKSEPISKDEFYKKIHEYINNYYKELRPLPFLVELYELFKSYHPESFTPIVSLNYEVSNDEEQWIVDKFDGFKMNNGKVYPYIRHIQQSEEELKFLELAEKFKDKYEVNKK